MKKLKRSVFTMLLVAATLLCATSCSLFTHPIERFGKKLEKEKSCRMTLSFTVAELGKVTMEQYRDGNITYYPANQMLGEEEYYTETVDDYTIEYYRDSKGVWQKDIYESEDDAFDPEKNDIYNADKYEKVSGEKNTYRQKKNVIFDNFEDVTISFVEDTCVIECKMTIDTMEVDAKIVFSEVGEISLTLPKVA